MCDCLTAECKLCQAKLNEESTPPTSLNDHDCLIDAMLKEYEEMIIKNPVVNENEAMMKACKNTHP